jgi:hypothetical protein
MKRHLFRSRLSDNHLECCSSVRKKTFFSAAFCIPVLRLLLIAYFLQYTPDEQCFTSTSHSLPKHFGMKSEVVSYHILSSSFLSNFVQMLNYSVTPTLPLTPFSPTRNSSCPV